MTNTSTDSAFDPNGSTLATFAVEDVNNLKIQDPMSSGFGLHALVQWASIRIGLIGFLPLLGFSILGFGGLGMVWLLTVLFLYFPFSIYRRYKRQKPTFLVLPLGVAEAMELDQASQRLINLRKYDLIQESQYSKLHQELYTSAWSADSGLGFENLEAASRKVAQEASRLTDVHREELAKHGVHLK